MAIVQVSVKSCAIWKRNGSNGFSFGKNHSDDIAEWIQIWHLSRYDVLELDNVALRRGNLSRKVLPPLTNLHGGVIYVLMGTLNQILAHFMVI